MRNHEPFVAFLDLVVESGGDPTETACLPDGLVGVVGCAVGIEEVEQTAVLAVEAVPQPERDGVVQQSVAVGFDEFALSLCVHDRSTRGAFA